MEDFKLTPTNLKSKLIRTCSIIGRRNSARLYKTVAASTSSNAAVNPKELGFECTPN